MTMETYSTPATFNSSFATEAGTEMKRTNTLKLWISEGHTELVEKAVALAKAHDDEMVETYKSNMGVEALSKDQRKEMREYFKAQKQQGAIPEMPDRASRVRMAITQVAPGKTVKGKDNKFQDVTSSKATKRGRKRTADEAFSKLVGDYTTEEVAAAVFKHEAVYEALLAIIAAEGEKEAA